MRHFFIFKSLRLKVLTIATINPSKLMAGSFWPLEGGPMKSQRSAGTEPRSRPRRSAPEQQATNREVRDKQGWGYEGSGVAHLGRVAEERGAGPGDKSPPATSSQWPDLPMR